MGENKTQPSETDPEAFVATVENDTRRTDAETMIDLMERVTGYKAKMWGPSIIGFGRYHYTYESGREGDFLVVGFAPRKANLVVYLMPGYEDLADQRARLGKHRIGKSCLYINKLADVDQSVLEEMITLSVEQMKRNYEVSPE